MCQENGVFAGQVGYMTSDSKTTQIYEGTNQVQRVVMARQLLKGLPRA